MWAYIAGRHTRLAALMSGLLVPSILACTPANSLAGLSDRPAAPRATGAATPAVGGLRVYSPANYSPPELVTEFEQRFQLKLSTHVISASQAILPTLHEQPRSFDLVIARDDVVAALRREQLLAPVNKANVPNLQHLDPRFANPVYDPANRYCVAYQWGTIGIGYNSKATGRAIRRWDDLFDPDFKGRVALPVDMRTSLGIALILMGFSPNTTSPIEIMRAQNFLLSNRDHIAAYSEDSAALLAAGQVDLVVAPSGRILRAMDDNPDLRYIAPDNAAFLWIDNLCIPAGAANRSQAEQFINYVLEPAAGAALADFTRNGSPNQAALPLMTSLQRTSPAIYAYDTLRTRGFVIEDVGPEGLLLYETAWNAIVDNHGS